MHVTGDQRFQFWCDGREVTFGPDRCDLEHWTVQSVRLDLSEGPHDLEAVVWWIAEPDGTAGRTDQEVVDETPKPPMAQMSWRGGFLVCTEDLPARMVNTGVASWTVEDLTDAVRMSVKRIPHYFDVGPSFAFDLEAWNAAKPVNAVTVEPALEPNVYGVRRPGRCLYPATLPEQKRELWTGGRIRAVREGWEEKAFAAADETGVGHWQKLLEGCPFTIPAETDVTVVWDFENYLCGYPQFAARGGGGAVIEWEWAEALYEEESTQAVKSASSKGHRGEILGKAFLGFGDTWKIGADQPARCPALWWRSGRFVRLRIATADEALTLTRLAILTTGYPLERGGAWKSSDAAWDRLMPIFEQAFRCAAHETWTDSPYYEQMCYVGDTMMHMLSNYAWFSDDRISRRAIAMFEWSRRPSGLVAERYPSAWRQESATYAMLWPLMVRDFVYWRDDPAFVKEMLPGVRSVVAELEGLARENGLLEVVPGWPYVDWVPGWPEGCGPGVREGDSCLVNFHWVLCLQAASQIEDAHGDPLLGEWFRRMAGKVFAAILERYWDAGRGLLLDTIGCSAASEHAQFFALLTGLLDGEKTDLCLRALREEKDLAPATISAAFYLLDALCRQGDEAEFHRRLAFWRALPDQGFTSTPEAPEPSRSDAHAWGAHPAWHSLASIAGIRPSAPGFRRVRIAPMPGSMTAIRGQCVHPRGVIVADLEFREGGVLASLILPENVSGEFVWKGRSLPLRPGRNICRL